MKFTVLILGLLAALPVFSQSRRQFDLRGDVLGESIETFKANHPRISKNSDVAYCYSVSDVVEACHDKEASLAGHTPYLDTKNPLSGMWAQFYKGKLTAVGYEVSDGGSGGDILDLFTKKFGKPTSAYGDTVCWETTTQRITVLHFTTKDTSTISVSLELIIDPDKTNI